MLKYPSSLTLNGIRYSPVELNEFCQAQLLNPDIHTWEKENYLFIQDWLSDEDFVLVHTSGSTGIPKVMRQPKERMVNSALMTQSYFGLNEATNALLCLPVSYIAGKMMIVRSFVAGMNLIAVEPSANPFLKVTDKINFTAITPFQLACSMDFLKVMRMETVIVGGGEIPFDLEIQCQGISSGIYATYAMTETSSHIALRAVNGADKSPYYKVLDRVEITADERNCLVIKAPDLTSDLLTTNDVVEIIDPSHFEWIGRFDSVINSGGLKIFPEQVEKKLFPLIPRRYFVAGIHDLLLGEKVSLFIEGEAFNKDQLLNLHTAMISLLSRFERPREIIFISSFDLSSAGKILKKSILSKYLNKR